MHSTPIIPRLSGVVSDWQPRPLAPTPQQPPETPCDLLAEAVAAYQSDLDKAIRCRELVLAREFRSRFGVAIEPPLLRDRTDIRTCGVWTFLAAGLNWKGGDDSSGAPASCWFTVRADDGSWHEASTRTQLGQLIVQGCKLTPRTAPQ